jgi:hypothetical protein
LEDGEITCYMGMMELHKWVTTQLSLGGEIPGWNGQILSHLNLEYGSAHGGILGVLKIKSKFWECDFTIFKISSNGLESTIL